MQLSLVVPCLNEESLLPRFHEAVTREAAATGEDYQIIFVDDGSRDDTLSILKKLAANDPHVRYLSFSRNFGKEAAMLAGMRYADGDAVIVMDADLQHPPEMIQRMVEYFGQGYDQVVARRTRSGDRITRTVTARLYYWLINKMVDVELVNGVGDFRLLSRRALDALLSLQEYNRFSKGLFSWIGFETVAFDYENVAREQGRSKWTVRKLLNYGLDGLLSFNDKPLRLAIYAGLPLTILSSLYAVWIILRAAFTGIDSPGYVTLMTAVILFGGIQLIMLGVIGEYIGRIYYETKQRPHYLLKEVAVEAGAEDGQREAL
jgi:glycosyltransferase involved in cell wall biosynthesis